MSQAQDAAQRQVPLLRMTRTSWLAPRLSLLGILAGAALRAADADARHLAAFPVEDLTWESDVPPSHSTG